VSRDRRRQHLGGPPEPDDLKRFPTSRLPPTKPLYRLHRRTRRPWYFSTSGAGRFDLRGPEGTCYGALEPAVAFIEVFYGFTIVPVEELVDVVVSTLTVPTKVRLADCTDPKAVGHLVTGEIATTTDYALTQRWAGAFRAAGFDGIRYWARHDTGRGRAVALFGPAGERDDWPEPTTAPLDAAVQTEVTRRYGVIFLDTDV
jgi:hypothetical protein